LKAGTTYLFELRASYKTDPRIFGTTTATIVVNPASVVANIDGGDRLFTLGVGPLTLDASSSFVTDGTTTGLGFSWTCQDNLNPDQPCFATSDSASFITKQSVINIPSTALTIGEYTFTVTVTFGALSDTASVVIYTNGVGPQISITVRGPIYISSMVEIS
jgi:hypothetical protein